MLPSPPLITAPPRPATTNTLAGHRDPNGGDLGSAGAQLPGCCSEGGDTDGQGCCWSQHRDAGAAGSSCGSSGTLWGSRGGGGVRLQGAPKEIQVKSCRMEDLLCPGHGVSQPLPREKLRDDEKGEQGTGSGWGAGQGE